MNRNTLTLLLVAAVSLVAGIVLFQASMTKSTHATITENSTPALSAIPFTDLKGNKRLIRDWQNPVLIVNFWAPWCAPCRREIPALIEIQREFGQQLQILGLAMDNVENVQRFSKEYGMNYPSFIAGSGISMYNAAFKNKSGSLPFTAILDQQRQLRFFHNGEITSQQLREKINELL